jgi:hypothetical protein
VESHRNADGTDGKKVGKYERIWMNMGHLSQNLFYTSLSM